MASSPTFHLLPADRRRMRQPVLGVLAMVVTIAAVAAAAGPQQPDYVVGAQDVLAITVWEQPGLSGKFNVEVDGTFTFPLIGRVQASSRTLRAIEADLKKRLADGFLKNPQLAVAVDQYRSQRVFVVGEVRQPGSYSLSGAATLIELLARAGSVTPGASGEVLVIRHTASGGAAGASQVPATLPSPDAGEEGDVVRVDLAQLERGVLQQNVTLKDGDTVFVPRADTVYVFGQVRSPGSYAIRKGTTLVQALALAGGVTEQGATNRIKAIRFVSGKRTEVKLKLHDPVLAGDTIIVPERFF